MRYPQSYVIYDLETTGLDTAKCEIVELAAIKVRDGVIVDQMETLVQIKGEIEPEAEAAHGITKLEANQNGVTLGDALVAFEQFIEDLPLVGHNIMRFDNQIIHRLFWERDEAEGNPKTGPVYNAILHCVDTAALFKAKMLGLEQPWHQNHLEFGLEVLHIRSSQKFNLAYAARELGIPLPENMHRALADAGVCNEIFKKLTV